MGHDLRPIIIAIFSCFLLVMGHGAEAKTLKIVFPSGITEQFAYEFSVIELALAYSYEDISLNIVEMDGLTGARLFEMVKSGDADLIFGGYSPPRNDQFLKVNIPITRGLLGHRVFITHRDNLAELSRVKTLGDLKKFCIGSASDWPDSDIMEQNGFCVDRAPRNRLWPMLSNKRFPLLTRAIYEAYREMPTFQKLDPDLVLVPNISLIYRFDSFIYVRKDNTELQSLMTNGLERAYASGAFMKNFENNPDMAKALDAMGNIANEFTIHNPILDDITQNIDNKYWQTTMAQDAPANRLPCPDDAPPCPEQGLNLSPSDDPSLPYLLATKAPARPTPRSH